MLSFPAETIALMRLLAACLLILLGACSAQAQTSPADKSTAPLTQSPNAASDAAALQIELLNRQIALLSQLLAQNQRGLVVYPIALVLPGPIACEGDCRATVETICRAVRYPNAYAYPATVPSGLVGTYVNGVCYGP